MVAILRAVLLFVRGLFRAEFFIWLLSWSTQTVNYVSNAACNPPTLGPRGGPAATTTAVHSMAVANPITTAETTASEIAHETIQTVWHNPPIVAPEKQNASIRVDANICDFPYFFMTASILPAPLNISDGLGVEEWEAAVRQLKELDRLSLENREAILSRIRPYQYWRFRRELDDLVRKPLEFSCATLRRLQSRLLDIALDSLEPLTLNERKRVVLDLLEVVGNDITRYTRTIQQRSIMPEWARWAPELRSDSCPERQCMLIGDESIDNFVYDTTKALLLSVRRVQLILNPGWKEKSEPVLSTLPKWVMKQIKDFGAWFGDSLRNWFGVERLLILLLKHLLWELGILLWVVGKLIVLFVQVVGFVTGISSEDVRNHGFGPLTYEREVEPGVAWKLFTLVFLICCMLTFVTLIFRRQFSEELNMMGTARRERPRQRGNRGFGPGPGGDVDPPRDDEPVRNGEGSAAGGTQARETQTAGREVVATQTEGN